MPFHGSISDNTALKPLESPNSFDCEPFPVSRGFNTPSETIISRFQASHGFTSAGSGGSSLTDDTTDYIFGTQSLRLETGATTNNFATARKTGLTLDMTGKYWSFYIKVSDPRLLSSSNLRLSASTTDFTANFINFDLASDATFFKANTWQRMTISWGHGTNTGTGATRSSIAAIQLKATTNADSNLKVWINGLSTVAEPAAGVCSITFDDGLPSLVTKAQPYLSKYGFVATAYVIPNLINASGFITAEQLKKLEAQGWDIAVHNDANMGTYSNAAVQDQLRFNKNYLKDIGCNDSGNDHYAYANGDFSETQLPVYRKWFRTCRSIVEGTEETIPPADPYRLRILNITEADNTTTVSNKITQAVNNKEWIILLFHAIVDSGATGTATSTTKFQTIIDSVNSSGIAVKPISQVVREN